MPALQERLTDEDIWHLVNYLRTVPDAARAAE